MAHTQDPTQDHTPDRVIHYAPGSVLWPGDRPPCGNESSTAVYSEDPRQVAGCADCLELVAKALATLDWYYSYCVNCMQEISAPGGLAWRRVVRSLCPACEREIW